MVRWGGLELAMLAVGVLGRQCSWYADVWCDGVALWGHALDVQEARVGTWLKGGATTHALAECEASCAAMSEHSCSTRWRSLLSRSAARATPGLALRLAETL